jgi:hypothetical protein
MVIFRLDGELYCEVFGSLQHLIDDTIILGPEPDVWGTLSYLAIGWTNVKSGPVRL